MVEVIDFLGGGRSAGAAVVEQDEGGVAFVDFLGRRARDQFHAIAMAGEALQLMQVEELRSLYAEQYDTLGRLYWAAGDKEAAVEHARISLEVLEDVGYVEHDPSHLPRLLATYGELGSAKKKKKKAKR